MTTSNQATKCYLILSLTAIIVLLSVHQVYIRKQHLFGDSKLLCKSRMDFCLESYNGSTTFERTMGRTVMMKFENIHLVCSLLSPDMHVLEYGSGGSSTFFSQFVSSWTSIEHDPVWADKVVAILPSLPWGDKIKIYTKEPAFPYRGGANIPPDGNRSQFNDYIEFAATLGKTFDLIIDDGRARAEVSKSALDNQLFTSKSSKLVVHDWEREFYKVIVTEQGYQVEKEDTIGQIHTASLLPPEEYQPKDMNSKFMLPVPKSDQHTNP